jgi:hypothetical protein
MDVVYIGYILSAVWYFDRLWELLEKNTHTAILMKCKMLLPMIMNKKEKGNTIHLTNRFAFLSQACGPRPKYKNYTGQGKKTFV